MKKVGTTFLLAIFLLWVGSVPTFAQGWAGNLQTGRSETSRHADESFQADWYWTADGHVPTKKDKPTYSTKNNVGEWAVPIRPPGYLSGNGKAWLVVKTATMNAGEINSQKTECGESKDLLYVPELDGYLLDLSTVPPGVHKICTTVNHMGGENVMHVIIFIFRSKREVSDQFGFWLHAVDPNLAFTPEEVNVAPFFTGFIPNNGAVAYESATKQPFAINCVPSAVAPQLLQDQPAASLAISVVSRGQLERSGTFWLQSVDGKYRSPKQTGERVVFSQLPPGQYKVFVPKGEGRFWEIDQPVFLISQNQQLEINVRRKR